MEPISTKFNLNDSVEQMDQILKSGDVIFKNGKYTPEDTLGARGAIMNAAIVSVLFTPHFSQEPSPESWAVVNDVLLSQIYKLVGSQPMLLNFEWNGCRLHAVFNTTHKEHIDVLLDSVGKIISLTDVINYKIAETGCSFQVRAAIDYGKVMAVPVDGNKTLWKVDGIQKLDEYLNNPYIKRLIITKFIHNNLKQGYQELFVEEDNNANGIYQADIVNIGMNNWLKEHKK
jgi:hypothetical protein